VRRRGECFFRVRAEAILGQDGSVGLAGILEDISELKRLEGKLRDLHSSARKTQSLIQDLLDPSADEVDKEELVKDTASTTSE